jgi:pyruvate dehydrogenase E2 component (dihydrolipoamide acetyltransferase)
METGNIKTWSKEVGDEIVPGDVLCAIETDKATMDYEMQEEGFIAKVLYPAGEKDVPLGAPLAILVENKEDIPAFANWSPQGAAPTPSAAPVAEAAPTSSPSAGHSAAPVRAAGERVFASPIARVTADAAGIAINSINGTGPRGRVVNADVQDAITAAKSAPVEK